MGEVEGLRTGVFGRCRRCRCRDVVVIWGRCTFGVQLRGMTMDLYISGWTWTRLYTCRKCAWRLQVANRLRVLLDTRVAIRLDFTLLHCWKP